MMTNKELSLYTCLISLFLIVICGVFLFTFRKEYKEPSMAFIGPDYSYKACHSLVGVWKSEYHGELILSKDGYGYLIDGEYPLKWSCNGKFIFIQGIGEEGETSYTDKNKYNFIKNELTIIFSEDASLVYKNETIKYNKIMEE